MQTRHKICLIIAALLASLGTLAWKQQPLPTYTVSLIQGNKTKESWVTTQPPFPQDGLLVIVSEEGRCHDIILMNPGMRLHTVKNP